MIFGSDLEPQERALVLVFRVDVLKTNGEGLNPPCSRGNVPKMKGEGFNPSRSRGDKLKINGEGSTLCGNVLKMNTLPVHMKMHQKRRGRG